MSQPVYETKADVYMKLIENPQYLKLYDRYWDIEKVLRVTRTIVDDVFRSGLDPSEVDFEKYL